MLEAQRKLVKSLHSEAQELLDLTDQADKEAWYKSPCTQALIKRIQADAIDIQLNWAAGGYTTESADGTLQRNSKYIGMSMAADEILEAIDEIKAQPIKEEIDGADPE